MRRATILHVGLAILGLLLVAACSDHPFAPRRPQTRPDAQFISNYPYPPISNYPIDCHRLLTGCPVDQVVQITGGDYFTCVRRASSAVDCWGKLAGQTLTSPTRVWSGATQIDAGASHACGINSSGQAFCWGDGYYGELGTGQLMVTAASATAVAANIQFTSISAGSSSTCGTAVNGVFCWGVIMNGWTGVANPTQVSPRTDYNNVSVGYAHACFWATPAPSTGSSLDCYGLNPHGEAGKDPTKYPTVPFTMPTYVYVSNAGADVSGQYTCANQVYGDLQCFGNNSEGQLGSTFYVSLGQNTGIPQLVGNGSLPHGLHQVATGRVHACAIDQGNVAFCWGYNGYGEIGNGALLNIFTLPQQVQTTHTFSALAAGLAHSCGIADDGHVYCWGGNFYGQLGNANTSVNSTAPILVSGT